MPNNVCCVYMCFNRGRHRFPKNEEMREAWIVSLNRNMWKPGKNSLICYAHFRDDDYIAETWRGGYRPLIRRLKSTAVPSIFPWTPKKDDSSEDDKWNPDIKKENSKKTYGKKYSTDDSPEQSNVEGEEGTIDNSTSTNVAQEQQLENYSVQSSLFDKEFDKYEASVSLDDIDDISFDEIRDDLIVKEVWGHKSLIKFDPLGFHSQNSDDFTADLLFNLNRQFTDQNSTDEASLFDSFSDL